MKSLVPPELFGQTGKKKEKIYFSSAYLNFFLMVQKASVFTMYSKKYDDAEEAARCYSDGTEIPSKFQSVADRYIIGCEHYCACKYAHTVLMNRIIVAFVISSPIQ